MGLKFIENGVERTLTEADMALPEFQDSYSDMFKDLHGFRPRGEYFWSPDTMLHFFNTFDAEIEAQLERDRLEEQCRLEEFREEYGIKFATLSEAYRHDEKAAYERHLASMVEVEAAREHKEEMMRRGSPLPYIEDWAYGKAA